MNNIKRRLNRLYRFYIKELLFKNLHIILNVWQILIHIALFRPGNVTSIVYFYIKLFPIFTKKDVFFNLYIENRSLKICYRFFSFKCKDAKTIWNWGSKKIDEVEKIDKEYEAFIKLYNTSLYSKIAHESKIEPIVDNDKDSKPNT